MKNENEIRCAEYTPYTLIKEGKLKEAYNLLIADKKNEKAIELLSRFKVVYTKLAVYSGKELYATREFEYNSRGSLLKTSVTSGRRRGKPMTTEWEYAENGDVIKQTQVHLDGECEIREYTYDSRRNKIKEVFTRGDNKNIDEFTYNEDDMLVKRVSTDQDDNVKTEERFYDSDKRLVKEVFTDFDGNIQAYEYTYDAAGNMIKRVVSDGDGISSVSVYEHNVNGKCVRTTCSYGEKSDVYETGYNEDGNVIKHTGPLSCGSYVIEYFYDEKGNRTKKITNGPDNSNVLPVEEEYSYDENGNLKRITTKFPDGLSSKAEYLDYLYFYYPDGLPKNDLEKFPAPPFDI